MQAYRNKGRAVWRIRVLLYCVAFLMAGEVLVAQPLVITGSIHGSEAESLPSASVQLLAHSDSTVIASAETNVDGEFSLRDSVRRNIYILKASFVGFESAFQRIEVPAHGDTLIIQPIVLREVPIRLEEVTIASKRDPIVFKGDTVEYRMEAFPTVPHANVESLLRKIPGLDIDRAGNVNAAGEPVVRIYINGKEVFGDNLQLVTKNLPADAVDKVQILDHKSDAERFSSSQSTSGAKAINIELKDDYQKMRFGSVSGGVGQEERYTAEGKFNYFGEGDQLLAILKSNNINNIELNNAETNATPKPADGLLTTHSGAINGFKNLSEKISVNASYHANMMENKFNTSVTRQNFLPEGVGTYSEQSVQTAEVSGHQAVAGIAYKDSTNILRVTASGNLSELTTKGASTRDSKAPDGDNGYNGQQDFLMDNANMSGNALLFFGHNFRRKGRALTVDGQFSLQQNELENENRSYTVFFDTTQENASMISRQRNRSEGYLAKITYTEPLGKRQQVSGFYSVSDRAAKSSVGLTDGFSETGNNSTISSGYEYQQAGLVYQANGKRLTFSAGAELQDASLSRNSEQDGRAFKKAFQNVLPHAGLNIRVSNHTRVNLHYNTSVREPSINELQPLESSVDPLNVFQPNLTLRPEYSHGLRLNFSTTDKKRKSFFLSGTVNARYTTNPINQSVTIAADMRRSTQFVNTDDSKSVAANINVSFPVAGLNSTLKLISSGSYRDQAGFINQIENHQVESSYRFDIEYSYSYETAFSFNVSGHYGVTSSENPRLFSEAQTFLEMGYLGEMHWLLMQRLKLSGVYHYTRLENAGVGFDVSLPLLHVSLEMLLLTNKDLVLSFSGNNLLAQSSAISQTARLTYIEQRTTEPVLGRIFMIGIAYHFK